MSDLMRKSFDSFLPDGSLWLIEQDGDLDKLFNGMAANHEVARLFLSKLSEIRNPYKTIFLRDLEKEFAITYNSSLTEDERRMAVASMMYTRGNRGTRSDLQRALDKAGFTAIVNTNDPAVDPALFISSLELLVNGELYYLGAKWYYDVPTTPSRWNLVFFVGGTATRDGLGHITDIAFVFININRVVEFKKIILKYKPTHSWAGLKILSEDPIYSGKHFSLLSYDDLVTCQVGFSDYTDFSTKVGKILDYNDVVTV